MQMSFPPDEYTQRIKILFDEATKESLIYRSFRGKFSTCINANTAPLTNAESIFPQFRPNGATPY